MILYPAQVGAVPKYIWIANFNDCMGKDSGNYTRVIAQESDDQCSQDSVVSTSKQLIEWKDNKKVVIGLETLVSSRFPDSRKT